MELLNLFNLREHLNRK